MKRWSPMKRTLAVLVSVVCVTSNLVLPASAENDLSSAETMELSKNYTHSYFQRVEEDDDWYYDSSHLYSFSPSVTDEYTVEVKGNWINENTRIEVHDQSGRYVDDGYYNEYLNRVTSTAKLYSGQRYYIEVHAGGESSSFQALTTSINKHNHENEKKDYEKCKISGYSNGNIDTYSGGYTEWCKVCGHEEYCTFPSPYKVKLSSTRFIFNKKVQTPTVKITDQDGKTFRSYKVKAPKSKAIGRYQLAVTFTGDYEGTIKVPYTIVPQKAGAPKLKALKGGFSASWRKVSGVDGYQIEWGLEKSFSVIYGQKTINKTTKFSIKNKYPKKSPVYFHVRAYKIVGGKKLYGNWSKTVSIKVK